MYDEGGKTKSSQQQSSRTMGRGKEVLLPGNLFMVKLKRNLSKNFGKSVKLWTDIHLVKMS